MKLLFTILSLLITVIQAADLKMFCKCFCGSNSTVFQLHTNDTKPCGLCTKQFCLDNVEDGICDGIADATCPSNDFKTACFARDSYKDEFIVYAFLVITFGLIVFSVVKPFVDRWLKTTQQRTEYQPVSNDEQ